MRTGLRAVALAALLLLPLLPSAAAVGAEPRPWSSYNALSDVTAIAIAGESTTIAAALGPRLAPGTTTPPGGTLPGVPTPGNTGAQTDLIVLDHAYGYAQNLTYHTAPQGRTHVAVSRDGTAIAALGTELVTTGSSTGSQHARFYYGRISAGGNWSTPNSFNRTIDLGLSEGTTLLGVELSDDGRRVAFLYAQGAQYTLRGYSFANGALDSAFDVRGTGTARGLAASGDLSRVLVVGQFPQGNITAGGAIVYAFGQGSPVASHYETTTNGTDARSGTISRDGTIVAVADGTGKVRVFRDAALAEPALLNASAQAVNLSMSEDGTRLAAYAGTSLAILDVGAATPAVRWNGTAPGQAISSVALNRTGGLIVVGSSGTGGGVYAYGEDDARPLWQLLGDTRAVAVDSAGVRVAYAQRAAIGAVLVPRDLSVEMSSGGKTATQRNVASPGTTSFEVTLRNDGAGLERVVFEEEAPGVSVATTTPVAVRPGEIVRTNVTIAVEAGLVGPRVFNLTARSLTSGELDNVTLQIAPAPTLNVSLDVNRSDVIAQLGRTSEILLTIHNNGTGDADVRLTATQTVSSGPLWNLTISESSLTALRGTRTSVKVLMTPPPAAENGTAATVDFTLEGLGIFDTERVVFRINPILEVEVNATGVTRLIEPGARAFYNVTVTNTGSLPRQFDLFYTITASDGRNWGVDMQAQTTRLEPLEKRVIPVTIVAPADAQPDERVAVLVSARSLPETENETIVNDNVTLYGIAIPPKITTTTPTGDAIPAPAPVLLVAAILLLGLLRRRPA